jgi:RNA polymerase sigma factor (sigma-70 family)
MESDLRLLEEEEIVRCLQLSGGKEQLGRILLAGAEARDVLMRSNIRLVISISKKWMNRNYAAFNSEGAKLTDLYRGGWDRPTLDEVIQEGVLGLARAVDKYDFTRGLRFSTYATHWITSYVRQSFQRASTGCLHVPAQLHDIKLQYRNVVKRYINMSQKIPGEDVIAQEIGVTVGRLRTAIRVTESLLSIDQPVYSGNAAFKGSSAGGDFQSELILADTLQCAEVAPEDHVQISFLRQSLENAMAAELSPHERDILRLRLGLDDGKTRTIREVALVCGGGISTSDVRTAERRAFKKLSSPNAVHAHNLLAYLDMAGIDLSSYNNNNNNNRYS